MESLAAGLLCGGESRRMGRDKATLEWQGEPLWSWQLAKLRALQPASLYLSARTDPGWRPAEVEFVPDAAPSCGPLSGLVATLARCSAEHLLVLAIDLPGMTVEHLQKLRSHLAPGIGVIPFINGRAEPLAAIYPRGALTLLAKALAGKNFALQPLVGELVHSGQLKRLEIAPADHALYRNVNTPQDLSKEIG